MNLSYLVTCHNETDSLDKLLSKLCEFKNDQQEIVLLDDNSTEEKTLDIIEKYKNNIQYHRKQLEKHYGKHKNYGVEKCEGKWIFQIDADEYPTDLLAQHIDLIIEQNNENEVLWIPRLNVFHGVTDNDIQTWGWKYDGKYINFPDYQSRLYRNLPHIRYQRRLHEKVEGFKSYSFMPPQEEYALVHEKTIEKQRATNIRYNQWFTQEENKGYNVK